MRRLRLAAGAALMAALGVTCSIPAGAEEPPAASANGAACAATGRALHALSEADHFHSRLVARTPGRRRLAREERFVMGNVAYANSPGAGRWVKLPLTGADRHALETGFLAHPLRDCRDEGVQDLGGTAGHLYTYQQILPGWDGETVASGRLWVAAADGLPRRYEGRHGEVTVAVTLDYEHVAPPYGR